MGGLRANLLICSHSRNPLADIYIYMLRPPLGLVAFSHLFWQFCIFWPNLGTKERGRATILQLRILDPRLPGDVQCDNLEFKIHDFSKIFSGILDILNLASNLFKKIWDSRFKIIESGFKIQNSRFQYNIFLGTLNLESQDFPN